MSMKQRALGLLKGAAAGLVATVAMKGVVSLLESKKKMRVKEAFNDRKPTENAFVDRINKRYKLKLSKSERVAWSRGLGWSIGAAAGALTSYLSRRIGAERSPLRSALLATVSFILVEEIFKPAFGVHPGPRQIPLQTQAAAIAGRATYGFVQARAGQTLDHMLSESLSTGFQ
jgi:hypothetical protein